MFLIRRIYDALVPANRQAVAQVQGIIRAQFPGLSQQDIEKLPDLFLNPLKYRFRTILFVVEDSRRAVKGFALLLHVSDLKFCFLDLISTSSLRSGGGIGGALYERVREEALALQATGLFFECLPDDPALCPHPHILKQNIARLRFYERYSARPIINTAYETPLKPGDDNPPYLVYDNLGQDKPLSRSRCRSIVRAILERKYGDICSPEYIDRVVKSIKDDPVKLRQPRYQKNESTVTISAAIPRDKRVVLIINDKHTIHHVRDRGYVEAPIRIKTILKKIETSELFERVSPRAFSEKYIRTIHTPDYIDYFKRICAGLEPGKSIYPYVFPIRNSVRPPKELSVRAGYYCIDTFTPINRNAYLAAKGAVDCGLSGAVKLLEGSRLCYVLVRPPGHHAEKRSFGGFCYFNTAAVSAQYLSAYGRVAILDIDYHHGNGQQDIFYERSDVLTVSIHGHPRFTYPYFSGFEDEKGRGEGLGYNVNVPLPGHIDGQRYREVLEKVLKLVVRFQPLFLIVALGLDTAKNDPTGTWSLRAKDFELNGVMIGRLRFPTLVIQEGGYNNRVLGTNTYHFFKGLQRGAYTL